MKDYQNILIVRTDRIGDVVLTTPAITALREAYLGIKISVLVAPQTRDIVEGNPCLDEVIIDDRKGRHRGFFGFLKLALTLRKKKFDLAIIFHTKKRTNLLCFLAGIPHRVGYRNNKFGFLLTEKIKDARPEGTKHETEYCLNILRHIGMDIKTNTIKLHMPIKKESEDWAERLFAEVTEGSLLNSDYVITIHPGASCISKRWPAKRFAELIDQLKEKYSAKIILIGGADNKKIAEEIKFMIKNPIIDLTDQTSVSELASLFKRCHLLISNDSGPVHVAVAVGTPVISIFGRNQAGLSPVRWRPLGEKDIVLHKEVGCEVCLAHNCMIGFECLEAITTNDVLEGVTSLLTPLTHMG